MIEAMRVLVTGATGYVGSHTVAALVEAGHDVRALARSEARVAPALAPFGSPTVEVAVGDVTDPDSVERALTGCDAVIHAASVFSMDNRKAQEMLSVNVAGTDLVLGTAVRLGLDPVVLVSSELALLPPNGRVLTPESPVGRPPTPYCRSKAESELVARRYREQGAPVVSVCPSAVWGPHDPHFGEGVLLCQNVLRWRYPAVLPGGMHISDVRDVARVHAAVLEPGRGPRAYLVAGHYISVAGMVRLLSEVTGRWLPFATMPKSLMLAVGKASDALQERVSVRMPWAYEGIWVLACAARCDDSRTREELGVVPRSLRETFADTARWLLSEGHITRRQAGRLAGS